MSATPSAVFNEQTIRVFVDSAAHYFKSNTPHAVELGSPYLSRSEPALLDYTGLIGISGRFHGCVYFTASANLVHQLLRDMGEAADNEELHLDLVGEIANILSGNARAVFGKDFMISVPVSFKGRPERIRMPKSVDPYVIPLHWQRKPATVVVCVEHE
jgi:chemotaxis protein CheX